MTSRPPIRESAREQYDSWHRLEHHRGLDFPPWLTLFLKHLDLRVDFSGKRILEVGCGRGEIATLVKSRSSASLTAGDFSLSGVAQGKSLYSETSSTDQISWYCADATRLPFLDASFDWLLCFETVEHLPDPAAAVREFARVLRPRGRLVLTTPNYFNAIGLYRGYLRLRGRRFSEAGQPINRFTTFFRTAVWLWRAGFKVLRFDGRSHFLPIAPGRAAAEVRLFDKWATWTRWIAIQTFCLAERGPAE